MSFAPLKWVAGTLTAWHLGAWIALIVFVGFWKFRGAEFEVRQFPVAEFVLDQSFLVILYVIGALIVGQIFGDKYSFSQVWPTSLVLGTFVAAFFMLWTRFTDSNPARIGFEVFAFLLIATFLGIAFNLFLYVMPRLVGWGLIGLPRLSWAVTT